MKHLFFGGIHPKYNKEMSTKTVTLPVITPKQVVIPLQQHIGIACMPLVKVGDRVLRGQKIGDGEGLCVPVHASVSGKVLAIEARPHPSLGSVPAVVIENDFQDEAVIMPIPETPEEILHTIREAGIVGMGGAAFPGDVKALSAMGKVDTLIANACECEPYITADDALLRTSPELVLQGMQILAELLQPEKIVLAVEDNKALAVTKIRSVLEYYPQVTLQVLPTRYPQGAEKQLIQAITGREVCPGELPVSVGCAVFNVSTFAAISSGGPMMGVAQNDLRVPVIKATNSVLCLLKDQNGAAENPVCLRCGKCVSVCPRRLQPLYMYRFVNAGRLDELERLHVTDCIECGSCAFTCPGKLPLVERFRKGKKMLKEAKVK